MKITLTLIKTFLRLFTRDRQAIFFSLFFPLVFMSVFSFMGRGGSDPIAIGIVNEAGNQLAANFIASLGENEVFVVSEGVEAELREQVRTGELRLVLVLPAGFEDSGTPAPLRVLVDAAEVRELGLVMPVIEQALVDVERDLRGTEPLFNVTIEDVEARTRGYLDFVVPGLLAFTIMQISVAGSGYNIVEYRRKGILKRLFVTPLQPKHFITALVIARSIICLVQLTLLLVIAVFVMDVSIAGRMTELYIVIVLGTAIFLSLGFCLGSMAKSQQAIMAIGNLFTFPQMFLSGIFYSIEDLPGWIQPLAKLLPLSSVATGLREVMVDGTALAELLPVVAGLVAWTVVALFLAIRFFNWKDVAT